MHWNTCCFRLTPKNLKDLLPAFLVALALGFLCAGCGRQRLQKKEVSAAGETSAGLISYVDGIGRQVRIPRHPTRIISLAPDITETLFLLNAQDRLIGDTIQCTWPEAAKHKPKIGDLLNPNYEVILAAKPDLIISSTAGNDRGAIMKLASFGLPVYVAAPRSVEQIFRSVEQIGRITDCTARGLELVSQMKERLERVRGHIAGLPPIRAFFITWFDPLLAPGKNTFENDVLRLAGVISITGDIPEFYPRFSLEQVIVKDPDVILTAERMGNPLPDLKRVAGWSKLRAVREGKIYTLSEFLQHPSPLFVDGVEDAARKLHPERFR
jgi:iron complex transport system substrate-binding protein